MKIVKWAERTDGSFAWVIGDRTLAKAYAVDGVWRTAWRDDSQVLSAEFSCANDACLAAEKYWPSGQYFDGWLESKNGGYFRKFNRRAVYVRKADDGWYAVQTDGKLLGKGGNVSWFSTAEDACRAVEKEMCTPIDADPFVNTRDQWRWIKFRKTVRAA